MGSMADEHPRFLRVARALALVSTTASCGGGTTAAPVTVAPVESQPAKTGGSSEPSSESVAEGDPTVGTGPCRCSWDSNTAAASRVCKKNEVAYTGGLCTPGNRPKFKAVGGPLPPPDLPLSLG